MNCPFCGCHNTKVLDSRPGPKGTSIRRRRECIDCSKRWRTLERVEDTMPLVLKKNGTQEPFNREKLLTAVKISCGKRPVSTKQMEGVVADIEWNLLDSGSKEVNSQTIGEQVMNQLKQIDEIAYVRYASVYRHFKDVTEMMEEIEGLIKRESKKQNEAAP